MLPSISPVQDTNGEEKGKRKNKLGRAARRRKAKVRAINEAFFAILRGESPSLDHDVQHFPSASNNVSVGEKDQNMSSVNSNGGTPQDRNRSLPGVLVRRREANNVCGEATKDICEGWREDDKYMLVSQLGFIPGNGICISSRVVDLRSKFPCLCRLLAPSTTDSCAGDGGKGDTRSTKEGARRLQSSPESPIVLKLYPLVIRDVHSGGKADGRKFKSRKRSHSHISTPKGNNDIAQSQDHVTINDAPKILDDIVLGQTKTLEPSEKDSKRTGGDEDVRTIASGLQSQSMTIEPFPTMYWLTHPYLRALISQLEIGSTHNVKLLEERLKSAPDYLKSMERAHVSYGTNRWELLTNQDITDIVSRRHWEGVLGHEKGVAGIRKHDTIKCLHAHVAHFLAQTSSSIGCTAIEKERKDENIVGRWAVEAIEEMLESGKWKAS